MRLWVRSEEVFGHREPRGDSFRYLPFKKLKGEERRGESRESRGDPLDEKGASSSSDKLSPSSARPSKKVEGGKSPPRSLGFLRFSRVFRENPVCF